MKKFENSMYTPNLDYTYPGKMNLELIQKPKINTPALTDFARVIQGIRCGEYINLVQPLTGVLTKGTADCQPTYTQSGSITDRRLDTGLFEINLEWCKKEFAAVCTNLSDSPLIKDGLDGYELAGELQRVIIEEVLEAARQDIWKIILFGNDSLGAGSTNKYSGIDGVWTKFFDAFASYCVRPVTNALPNGANSTLAADQARDTFRAMWGGAPTILKQMADNQKVFWVTGSMWENYYDSLINNCCVEGSWRLAQDGTTVLKYRGIDVKPLWIADDALANDTSNPYYNILRHFAIYTTPSNHMIGVENSSDLNNIRMCYDCYRKSTLLQGEMRFGYNFAQCDLQVIAF